MRGFRIYDNTKKRYVTEDVSWVVTPDGMCSELDGGDLIGYPDCIKEDDSGLTDKNGKKIFEGDILEFWQDKTNTNKGIVEYKDCWFGLTPIGESAYCLIDIAIKWHNAEIIGNIHDNKELLEVNKESSND